MWDVYRQTDGKTYQPNMKIVFQNISIMLFASTDKHPQVHNGNTLVFFPKYES